MDSITDYDHPPDCPDRGAVTVSMTLPTHITLCITSKHYENKKTKNQLNTKLEVGSKAGQAILSGSKHNTSQNRYSLRAKGKEESQEKYGAETCRQKLQKQDVDGEQVKQVLSRNSGSMYHNVQMER